jgi:hypothetical protein
LEGRFRGLTHVLSGLAENSLKTAGFPSALWSRHFEQQFSVR